MSLLNIFSFLFAISYISVVVSRRDYVIVKKVGCYRDTWNRAIPTLEGKDGLLDGRYKTRRDAINKCAKAAKKRGYKVFAVQDGGWCASSATAQYRYDKYGVSTACKSDGEGGPWANQVYTIGDYAVNKKVGCHRDTWNRAIPTLEGKDGLLDGRYKTRRDAINKCAKAAKKRGYKVFAVQHGGWCASSATAQYTYDKYGVSTACKSDGEGGPWANQVYTIGDYVIVKKVGCYRDTWNRAVPTLEGKDGLLDGRYRTRRDAINKCAKAAKKRGYKVFAVQDGGWCASSATAQYTYDKYGVSTACESDGEGGPWANQVYTIGDYVIVKKVGCYRDTWNRAIPTLEGKDGLLDGRYRTRRDAINKCAKAAKKRCHKVFAVQHGGWCASSATAQYTYDKYGVSTACKK